MAPIGRIDPKDVQGALADGGAAFEQRTFAITVGQTSDDHA
jgi:hypothetical protein